MKKTILFLVLAVILLSGCAHTQPNMTCLSGEVYGFWNGLWHGLISGLTFIGSLFNKDVAVYAVNNNGGWYNFGFLFGVSASLGGGTKIVHHKRHR